MLNDVLWMGCFVEAECIEVRRGEVLYFVQEIDGQTRFCGGHISLLFFEYRQSSRLKSKDVTPSKKPTKRCSKPITCSFFIGKKADSV